MILNLIRWRPARYCATLAVLTLAAGGTTAAKASAVAQPSGSGATPIVRIDDGLVRGASAAGVYSFLGLPYAAPPTGNLRWRPPQPAAAWSGVRDALSTHGTELPYLFNQPNAPYPATLTASQQALAASMRADWASFAASGNPSTSGLPWPSFGDGANVLSLVPAASTVQTDFAAAHHCSFWAAG